MFANFAKPRKVYIHRLAAMLLVVHLFALCSYTRSLHRILQMTPQEPLHPIVNIVIHPSSCEEGPTSKISTTSLSTAASIQRRGEYPYYHHISQIVEGPALTATNVSDAVCKFRNVAYRYHFPHT